MLKKVLIVTLVLAMHPLTAKSRNEKVLILTYTYNRPDFLEWQCKTLKKFLQDPYDVFVFNDARDARICKQIESICDTYKVQCLRVPQNHPNNNPSARHQDAIRYSLQTIGFKHNGMVCMLDGDMFLVKPFSIRRFMKDYDIAGFPQNRSNKVCYLFPGLVFLNMASLPNKETMDWSGGYINGDHLDTGGQMHHYLKNNPNIRLFHMNQIHLGRRDKIIENVCQKCDKINNLACTHNTKILSSFGLDKHGIKFLQSGPEGGCEFFLDGNFFHYRAASWSFSIDHNKKTLLVSKYMNDILNSK